MNSKFTRLFHEQTNFDFIPPKKRVDESLWPEEKVVQTEYKSYPRLKKITLLSPDFPERKFKDILDENKSVQKFHQGKLLALDELSSLLYYACGTRPSSDERFYESQGLTFPLEVYLMIQRVEGVPEGVYHYNVRDHSLEMLGQGNKYVNDFKDNVVYPWAINCAVGIVITAVWGRNFPRYGDLGYRLALFEAAHLSGNLSLISTSLGINFCDIDIFSNSRMDKLLDIGHVGENSLSLIVFGKQ